MPEVKQLKNKKRFRKAEPVVPPLGIASFCACVRHTVMDSTGYGFKMIVPEGTVGDRVLGVVEWNLFDMEAKFCDVVPVDEVVKYLEGIDPSVYTKHERKFDK